MKVIMEFNLPEDAYDYETSVHAYTYRRALAEALENLRAKIKYGGPEDAAIQPFAEQLRSDIYTGLEGAPEP